MGKTKTKYPVQITLQFFLPLTQRLLEKEVVLKVHSPLLKYEHIKKSYMQFLQQYNINYLTVIYYTSGQNRQQITEDFQIDVQSLLVQQEGRLMFLIQNYLQSSIDQLFLQIQQIKMQIDELKEKFTDFPTRQQLSMFRKNSLPVLHHNRSVIAPIMYQQKQIDLAILFSQPIFDEIRNKPAANPVDFRSQIQRLHIALKSALKPDIALKCQIATKQNLKHLVKYSKPKILHIICHGRKQGQLQFQDDSRTVLGTLQLLNNSQIMNALKQLQAQLPQVVFINSCYSQRVGEAFHKLGVNYVITIDCQDKIQDEAAQIFSQHFYRNIFSGQKVKQAFKQARERVKMRHNSFACCCRHSSRQKHKKNCRWFQMIRMSPTSDLQNDTQKLQKHKLFHVPSDLCKCQLKNLNRHKINCQWAKQALFHINNDFRILDQNGSYRFPKKVTQLPPYLPKDELVICCCFNYQGTGEETGEYRLPHSQSNKFKIIQNQSKNKDEAIFQITTRSYKQINDYTAPQLVQTHQKIESSIMGRQKEIYDFIKRIKDLNQVVYIVTGKVGVGRTSFALKCVTYLIQRKIFQMYFYIDLYDIKDKDIFRYKFNQITKFNYDGQIKINQVKNKSIIIILDNVDAFFQNQRDQFYEELKFLRQQLHKGKIILNMKQQNRMTFDYQKIHAQTVYLGPLTPSVATSIIFCKMRHLFQGNVQLFQVEALVRSNQSLRIPKIIQSICQSFSSSKTKIKVSQIKKKLQNLAEGDVSGYKFIDQNLSILKETSQQSYQLLLFISQFSEGISIDDIKMLSLYDKKDSVVHLPITMNWQSNFANLFQKFKIQKNQQQTGQISSVITQQSQSLNMPALKYAHSIFPNSLQNQKIKQKEGQNVIKGQSYFLDQVSQNRFIVKRYIRDHIWNKHHSQSNYYMKHIFVGYMALMLEIYFKWLIQSKYMHEDLIQYSALTQAGLFSFKNNIFTINTNLTQSVRIAKQYNSQFYRIFSKHETILQKIKKSDPSSFITNHKQDFLNIYQKRWDDVFKFLKETKKNYSDKICMGYLQNLMIYIPTAFKIAKVQTSLLRYVISKSMSLLQKIQKYSQDQKYSQNQKILAIQLKLQLMKASIQIQKTQVQSIKQQLQFNKGMTHALIKSITDSTILGYLTKYWNYERTYILMFKQYITKKQSLKIYNDKSKIASDKIKSSIENIVIWMKQDWNDAQEILFAKRNLIIGLTYLYILKNTIGSVNALATTIKLKRQYQKSIIKLVNDSFDIFKSRDLMKLCLKAKLTNIQIYSLYINMKKKIIKSTPQTSTSKNLQFYEQLSQKQRQVQECEKIYVDRKNNLISFAEFETQIKSLKKLLKQKLWEQSSNTLVCMKPIPLTTNGKGPIIQNLPRKKNKFRKQIQKMIDPQIDLCSKFQILTKSKLKQEVQNGCTVLLLSANIKVKDSRPCLVFQGSRMQEDLVQINSKFIQQFQMSKIKILIIVGKNSSLAIQQLAKLIDDPPFMISLGNLDKKEEADQFKEFQQDMKLTQSNFLIKIQQIRRAQVAFLKQFVRKLMATQINQKDKIIQICIQCSQTIRDVINMKIECSKRKSALQIHHKKGSYKDLSPGYQKNHNIDMKLKASDNMNFISLRRWKQTYRVFDYIQRRNQMALNGNLQTKQSAVINIFGDIGSGKSSFVQQIARIFVQRQKFTSGVYIIDGKVLQKNYQGDFQTYFNKQSEAGKIMSLQDFQRNGNQQLMLIIDDFHFIKPRSNGRFNLFLQKIVDKKVNLIIVTNSIYLKQGSKQNKKDTMLLFKKIKPIKIQKLCPFETDLIAYYTLDLTNKIFLQKYEQMKHKLKGDVGVKDIAQLKSNLYSKKKQNQFSSYQTKQFKKQQSYKA